MFVWIDPPGPEAGWIHDLADWDELPDVIAGYPIPEDNEARKTRFDENPVGERDYWGVTAIYQLPDPLPNGIIRINENKG